MTELVCANCTYTAPRLVKGECDACWKYRKRHNGRARPTALMAHAADVRASQVQLGAERALLRVNGTLNQPVGGFHDQFVDGPDGRNYEVIRP